MSNIYGKKQHYDIKLQQKRCKLYEIYSKQSFDRPDLLQT